MSYCRWSSMNGACDIYAYEGDFGYAIHVAGQKRVNIENAPPDPFDAFLLEDKEEALKEFQRRQKIRNEWDELNKEYAPIGLAYDGQSYTEETLQDFKERLLILREAGYKFPDYVLTAIEEEIDEEETRSNQEEDSEGL